MLSPIAVTMGLPSSKDNTVTRGRLDHAKVKHTVPYRRYCTGDTVGRLSSDLSGLHGTFQIVSAGPAT